MGRAFGAFVLDRPAGLAVQTAYLAFELRRRQLNLLPDYFLLSYSIIYLIFYYLDDMVTTLLGFRLAGRDPASRRNSPIANYDVLRHTKDAESK